MRSGRLLAAAVAGGGAAVVLVLVIVIARLAGPGTDDVVADAPSAEAEAGVGRLVDGPGYDVWDRQEDGSPVRWDPCTPIRWVLESDGAPATAREVVSRAILDVERATGLRFEFAGTTDEVPSAGRSLVDGDRWAPVLVSWSSPSEVDLPLDDGVRGVAVPVAVRDGDQRVFVTGQVVLNADLSDRLLPGFEDRHASWGATVLHELGHLVGLAHVEDPVQLMFPAPGFGPVELGPGDLAGLAELGEGGCVTVPPAEDLPVTYAPAT